MGERPNAIVLRSREAGECQPEFVPGLSGGLKWTWDDGREYYLVVEVDGKTAIYEPPDEVKLLPSKLHRALYGWAPARRLFSYKQSLMEKIEQLLWLAFGCLVVIFLMVVLFSDAFKK